MKAPPAFCPECGTAYPWTVLKKRAAIDLFIEESMDEAERRAFAEGVDEIARATPQAQVASGRIAKQLGRIGKASASAIRDILVDIASEGAKRMLLPGS